jgi:anti-anti-sigma factor
MGDAAAASDRGLVTLSITARHPTSRATVLVLQGVIDYRSAADLRAAISAAVARQPAPRVVVVDLGAVSYVDDIGVGTLVVAGRICRDVGVNLVARRPTPLVRESLGKTDETRSGWYVRRRRRPKTVNRRAQPTAVDHPR